MNCGHDCCGICCGGICDYVTCVGMRDGVTCGGICGYVTCVGMGDSVTCVGMRGGETCGDCMCGGTVALSDQESDLLRLLAQAPFLPVTRREDTGKPMLLGEESRSRDAFSEAIEGLSEKRLIQLDYDIPLKNFDYKKYRSASCNGSIALTAAGQDAIDWL